MEENEVLNISIPVYLNPLYVSSKHVERIELLLEIYPNIASFFNSVVSDSIKSLIEDGSLNDYEVDRNEQDDTLITYKLRHAFREHIDEHKFGSDLLDDLGYSASEIKPKLKLIAYYLIEASLATCHDYICGEASDRGKRLSHILALSAVREFGDRYGLPTAMTIEAQISLDSFRRIGQCDFMLIK